MAACLFGFTGLAYLKNQVTGPSPEDCYGGDGPRDYCLGVELADSIRLGSDGENLDADSLCEQGAASQATSFTVIGDLGEYVRGCKDALNSD